MTRPQRTTKNWRSPGETRTWCTSTPFSWKRPATSSPASRWATHHGTVILRPTWAGYDLLDSIRDESVWAKVRERIGNVGGSVSIDVLKAVAIQVVKDRLGLPPE